jgi:hypothetical protein
LAKRFALVIASASSRQIIGSSRYLATRHFKTGHSWIPKTELNWIGGLRTYVQNRAGRTACASDGPSSSPALGPFLLSFLK